MFVLLAYGAAGDIGPLSASTIPILLSSNDRHNFGVVTIIIIVVSVVPVAWSLRKPGHASPYRAAKARRGHAIPSMYIHVSDIVYDMLDVIIGSKRQPCLQAGLAPARKPLSIMITAAQLRAARALLGMDQRTLAEVVGLSVPTIQRMEASDGVVRGNVDSLMKVIAGLNAAGIELIGDGEESKGGGRGVRLLRKS
jgi:DNA-binding XRE family transcriptional regulator